MEYRRREVAIADDLVAALGRLRGVLEAGEPEERKAVVRAFLQGVTIDKTTRLAILRWYRLPRIDGVPVMLLVEAGGIALDRSGITDEETLPLPAPRQAAR